MFENLSFRTKLQMLGLGLIALMLGLVVYVAGRAEQAIVEGRRDRTKRVVEVAASTARYYAREVADGRMSEVQARAAAIAAIKAMRYEGEQYFWINDFDAVMVMHPTKPELDGKDLKAFEDPRGKRIFSAFAEIGRGPGSGVVDYLWPKPGSSKPVRKISYVQAVPEWRWVVGSGVYVDDLDAMIAAQRGFLAVVLVAVVALGVFLTRVLSRLLSARLDHVVRQAKTAATGDLAVRVGIESQDEFGHMSKALDHMLEQFRATLAEVQSAAHGTAAAADQLSAGSQSLASGAHEQAASLEETAATLQNVTASVQQTARNAEEAARLADGARDVAERGGQVVHDTVTAMREIDGSSKRISEIISTIDEIAFQTNLLALNAAVEAARAGEQGRGFAVVASEVRHLAQRAAAAARETTSLIQDSVRKVEAGTGLVNRSGAALEEIVRSVQHVTTLVREIAAASREQADGVEQVNVAVRQMDQVTQSGVSQTEQVASTAVALSEQARHMQGVAERFRLETTQASPAPAEHRLLRAA
jgi:methyl-accepting chemotaxis protein